MNSIGVSEPAADQFPHEVWARLLARHARSARRNPGIMHYGGPMGHRPFREAIAEYLRTARAVRCEADQVMGDMLEEEHAKGPFRILMHCYTSGAELAARAAALGAWFSVSGIATFKAAEDVRSVVRDMPADRIIVETDCPYLAPVPHRGRRNEPAYLPDVLAKLAEIRGWSRDEAEARTEAAFFALFDRIPHP